MPTGGDGPNGKCTVVGGRASVRPLRQVSKQVGRELMRILLSFITATPLIRHKCVSDTMYVFLTRGMLCVWGMFCVMSVHHVGHVMFDPAQVTCDDGLKLNLSQ